MLKFYLLEHNFATLCGNRDLFEAAKENFVLRISLCTVTRKKMNVHSLAL